MKKIISTNVVLCALLSSSLALVGMDPQKKQQLTNSSNTSAQSTLSIREKIEATAEEFLDDLKAVDAVAYNMTNPIVEAVKDNPKLIVGFMEIGGMKKEDAEGIMQDHVGKIAGLVDETQDKLHALIQDLGKSHDSLKKSQDADTKS